MINFAMDGQPINGSGLGGGMDVAVGLGCNLLHRYDSGPSKNVTVQEWMSEADKRGLKYIVQGTVLEAAGVTAVPPGLIAVAHDDEPDLNRWDGRDRSVPDTEWAKTYYPPGEMHPAMTGWTRYEILEERYARWKARWPGVPVLCNLALQNAVNVWTKHDQAFQGRYIKASDWLGGDLHPANMNWPAHYYTLAGLRRLKLFADAIGWKGEVVGGYAETSFEGLNYAGTHAPSADDVERTIWGILGLGLKQVWLFTQRVDSSFRYDNMTPEVRARVGQVIARVKSVAEILEKGERTVEETPWFDSTPTAGRLVIPKWTRVTWKLGNRSVMVETDWNPGGRAVVTTVDGTQSKIDELMLAVAERDSKIVGLIKAVEDLKTVNWILNAAVEDANNRADLARSEAVKANDLNARLTDENNRMGARLAAVRTAVNALRDI